jgi:MFS family permease
MILPLYFVVFIAFFGFSVSIPTFTNLLIHPTDPTLAQMTFGTRTVLLGSLIATYPIGQFFGGSILGTFSDQIGRKKTLLLTLLLAMICYAGITYAIFEFRLWLLYICLFIGGLCEANVAVAQNAIADVVPPEKRAQKFGYIFAWVSIGYVLGATSGAIFSNNHLVSWFGNWSPFALVFLLLTGCFIWIQCTFKETFTECKHIDFSLKESFGNFKNVFTDRRLRFFYLINALLNFSMYGFWRTYPMFITHTFDLELSMLTLFMVYVGIAIVIWNFFFIKPLLKVFTPFILTALTSLLMGVSICLIPAFHSSFSLWFTLLLSTSFATVCLTACTSLISHAAGNEEQGKVMGNNLSIQGAMTALSSIVGGGVAAFGMHWPMLLFGCIGLLTAGILFFNRTKKAPVAEISE